MLLFCRDGILRRSHGYYDDDRDEHISSITPLRAFEIIDPHIFLKCLNEYVEFEEGLTVLELFENLAPWAQIMIGVACMDFPAFLDEARKQVDSFDDIDRIEISYRAELKTTPKFKDRDLSFKKIKDSKFYELTISDPEISDLLEIEAHWSSCAYYKEPKQTDTPGFTETTCSVDMSPISQWSHLPIAISDKAKLFDETPFGSGHLSDKTPITNVHHSLAKETKGTSGNLFRIEFPLYAHSPTFYDTIIRGFLWEIGFFYSPVMRDAKIDQLKQQVESLDTDDDDYETVYDENRKRERVLEKHHYETLIEIASKLDETLKTK